MMGGDTDPAASSAGEPAAAVVSQGGVPRVAFDASSLYALRVAVAVQGARLGLTGRSLDAAMVVVTELATNVIRHGGGRGRLLMWKDSANVYCQVSDAGPGIIDADTAGTRPAPMNSISGRGLWIVRQFCAELTIICDHMGTTVTARFTLGS